MYFHLLRTGRQSMRQSEIVYNQTILVRVLKYRIDNTLKHLSTCFLFFGYSQIDLKRLIPYDIMYTLLSLCPAWFNRTTVEVKQLQKDHIPRVCWANVDVKVEIWREGICFLNSLSTSQSINSDKTVFSSLWRALLLTIREKTEHLENVLSPSM